MKARDRLALVVEAGRRWVDDGCLRLAAALSYYAVFSLLPVLLLLATALGFALGEGATVRRDLLDWLTGATGSPALRSLLDDTLASLQSHRTARGVGAVVGLVALLFGASGVFSELDSALNTIWRVKEPDAESFGAQVLLFVRRKSWSFLLVLAAEGLALVSWLVSVAAAAMSGATRGLLPWPLGVALAPLDLVLSTLLLTGVLALMFHTLPRTRVAWMDVVGGAGLAAIVLTGLKRLLAFYLAHLGSYAAYGALGAILGLMTVLYVSCLVVLFGAELTRVYAERMGSLASGTALAAMGPKMTSAAPKKQRKAEQAPDHGFDRSHGYGEGHGGPSGPGDVPAPVPPPPPAPPKSSPDDEEDE